MGLVENENKVILGFKGVIVIFLIAIFIAAIIALANDFPAMFWLGISLDLVVICSWICLEKKGNQFVYIVLGISILIVIFVLVAGWQSEWLRLTSFPKLPQ